MAHQSHSNLSPTPIFRQVQLRSLLTVHLVANSNKPCIAHTRLSCRACAVYSSIFSILIILIHPSSFSTRLPLKEAFCSITLPTFPMPLLAELESPPLNFHNILITSLLEPYHICISYLSLSYSRNSMRTGFLFRPLTHLLGIQYLFKSVQ